MVPDGYDPDDLDRAIKALLNADGIPEYLTDDE
jgi:hypothetical protein